MVFVVVDRRSARYNSMASTINKFAFYFCSVLCTLGMENGDILDSQINASSEYSSHFAAHRARLHLQPAWGHHGSWVSSSNVNQWLQVDLGSKTRVARIATQGRAVSIHGQWVTYYKLQYSDNGQAFMFYRQNGHDLDTVPNFCLIY